LEDHERGDLKAKIFALPHGFDPIKMPQIEPGFQFEHQHETHTFSTRRPGFLHLLSDEQYCHAFAALMPKTNQKFHTWMSWTNKLNRECATLIPVLQNIMHWYNPEWRYPEKASLHLRTFQWQTEIVHHILQW
jgi:hypothetical protein